MALARERGGQRVHFFPAPVTAIAPGSPGRLCCDGGGETFSAPGGGQRRLGLFSDRITALAGVEGYRIIYPCRGEYFILDQNCRGPAACLPPPKAGGDWGGSI